jgi:hypothetical protein
VNKVVGENFDALPWPRLFFESSGMSLARQVFPLSLVDTGLLNTHRGLRSKKMKPVSQRNTPSPANLGSSAHKCRRRGPPTPLAPL